MAKYAAAGLIFGPVAQGPLAELNAQGAPAERFVYATRGNVPDVIQKKNTTYRVLTDQLGSVRLVVDADTGELAQELRYDEFGRVTYDSSPGFQPFGFAGGIYDADTGLTHFGAREYDAESGRWTTSDPIGFAGGDSNLYGYVAGDVVNAVDASGLVNPNIKGPQLEPAQGSQPAIQGDAPPSTPPLSTSYCFGGSLHIVIGGSLEVCYNHTPGGSGFGVSGGVGIGLDAGGNAGVKDSNARCPGDFRGGFRQIQGSAGEGPASVGASYAHGKASDGYGVTVVGVSWSPSITPAGAAYDQTETWAIGSSKCGCT